ncbi:MAG: Stp1/IreP family PP2C-type Ser/Thr phosphatase [Gammaproteobacteria bacterium]
MSLSEKLEIANISDAGKRRPHNEDSTLSDAQLGLVVLADGMGGYKAGEVASAIAVTAIHSSVKAGLKSPPDAGEDTLSAESELIKQAIIHSNSEIYKAALKDEQCQGMGTTIIAVLFHDNAVTIGHVGDSRVYRMRNNLFRQITRDHSLIQELIDRGVYTPEEAAENTPRNLVTRALGIDRKVQVEVTEEAVLPGDIYLLCSDGLNDMVNDEEIHLTLSKYSANLAQAAEELVRLANMKGGKDNISIILIRVQANFSASRGGLKNLISRFF